MHRTYCQRRKTETGKKEWAALVRKLGGCEVLLLSSYAVQVQRDTIVAGVVSSSQFLKQGNITPT
jgi:hypothetical protein